MTTHGQSVQRGDIVLQGNTRLLVLVVHDDRAFLAPLVMTGLPHYRSDMILPDMGWTARCHDARWTDVDRLHRTGQRIGPALMLRVERALLVEWKARAIEREGPGIFWSTLARGPKIGSCGRRVGGAPGAE